MKYFLPFFVLMMTLLSAPVYAQVPISDIMSSSRGGCAGTVAATGLVENAELAFTGRVIKRSQSYTWFRIYVTHRGKAKGGIIKTAGFFDRGGSIGSSGQSYEVGKVYTVIVHRPATKAEKQTGADYFNSLDHCEEAVISTIHDRYGNYRVKADDLRPNFLQKWGNHWFFYKAYYLIATLLLVGVFLYFRFKSRIQGFIARSQQ